MNLSIMNEINNFVEKMILDKKSQFNQDFGEDLGRWGPFITYYDSKDNCVVHIPNPGFARLLKANFFKIDNPPTFYLDDSPDIEWDEYKQKNKKIPKLNMHLEFKLPLKVDTYNGNGKQNICIEYLFEMDPLDKFTKRCFYTISHFYVESIKQTIVKDFINNLEMKYEKCKKNLSERNLYPVINYLNEYEDKEKFEFRIRRMLDIFNKYNHNFIIEKKQFLYYEEPITFIEKFNKWW